MTSGIYEQYQSGPVPQDIHPSTSRYLEDEFHRIAELTAPKKAPGLFYITNTELLVPIENPPGTWNKLFVGIDETVDLPDGSWDSVTGTWTCPFAGTYVLTLTLQWFSIGTQGGGFINLFAGIAENGANPPTYQAYMDVPVGTGATVIPLTQLVILDAAETIEFYAEALSTQTTQTADLYATAEILKI